MSLSFTLHAVIYRNSTAHRVVLTCMLFKYSTSNQSCSVIADLYADAGWRRLKEHIVRVVSHRLTRSESCGTYTPNTVGCNPLPK